MLELLKQGAVNVAFTGFVCDQIPEVAYFGLADTMDATEALLNAVGIPWEIVIDHQVGTLKVNALASGVRRKEYLYFRVVPERLCAFMRSSRPCRRGSRPRPLCDQAVCDTCFKIIQRVTMLGENNELLTR